MARRAILAIFGSLLGMALLNGCSKAAKPAAHVTDGARIIKIKVQRDGVILLNDEAVTTEGLRAALSKGASLGLQRFGTNREDPAGDPHANATLVLQAIMDARLPVKLSTKPDFSEFVGADGRSHPSG